MNNGGERLALSRGNIIFLVCGIYSLALIVGLAWNLFVPQKNMEIEIEEPIPKRAEQFFPEPTAGYFILQLEAMVDGHLLSANQGCPDVWEERRRNTHDPFIFFGSEDLGRCYRGFAAWDISSIPDGAIISDLLFSYDGNPRIGNPPSTAQIRGVLDDECTPGGFVDSTLWRNLRDGGDSNPIYVSNWRPEEGPQSGIDLGQRAKSDLEQRLRTDQFCISFSFDTEHAGTATSDVWVICATEGKCSPAPTLVVGYETTSQLSETAPVPLGLQNPLVSLTNWDLNSWKASVWIIGSRIEYSNVDFHLCS